MKIGSLFSGYGGLDMGVQSVIGGDIAWHVEFDKAPSAILNHHWPDIPNYGDIQSVDWSSIPPVDVLTGGFPCQDVSLAGRRAGLTSGTRSGLWSEYARAIDVLRPSLVVIENVRGLLSAEASGAMEPDPWSMGDGATRPVVNALGVVLGDLASLGYDARWCGLRAADAGAPHGRFRVFIVAHPEGQPWSVGYGDDVQARRGTERQEPAARSGADAHAQNNGHERSRLARHGRTGPPDGGNPAAYANGNGFKSERGVDASGRDVDGRHGPDIAWGPYEPAIRRWESVTTQLAPSPTIADGRDGGQRLSPVFVEWMMGLPAGHVTSAPISRADQLKALGNGVVPQQAALALRHLLAPYETWQAAA
jgi:DNA (cytosine-5)-methyltransferase 1